MITNLPKQTRRAMRKDPQIRREMEKIVQDVKNDRICFPYVNSFNERIAVEFTNNHGYTVFDTGAMYVFRCDF